MLPETLASRLGIGRFRADEHYRAGLAAFAARDLGRAIQELNAAVELLPRHAEYHAALGFLLLNDKRRQQARDCFELALDLNRLDMLANYGQGMVAYRDKRWHDALSAFETAFAAQPKRPETQYYLAMAYHRLGRNSQALRWMDEARASFAKTGDRREAQCDAWLREFQKLIQPE